MIEEKERKNFTREKAEGNDSRCWQTREKASREREREREIEYIALIFPSRGLTIVDNVLYLSLAIHNSP